MTICKDWCITICAVHTRVPTLKLRFSDMHQNTFVKPIRYCWWLSRQEYYELVQGIPLQCLVPLSMKHVYDIQSPYVCNGIHGDWLGQGAQLHFEGCLRPCNICSEGLRYADPLIIKKGPAGFVELAICGHGGCRHFTREPKTLVPNVPWGIVCKITRQAIKNIIFYIYPWLESCDFPDAGNRCMLHVVGGR